MEVYDFWIIALLLGLASYFILRMALNSATTGKQPKAAAEKPAGGAAPAPQGKTQAPAKAAPAAAKSGKDAPKKKLDAGDSTKKKPAAKPAVAKKETVVAAAVPNEDEEVLDRTPLTGDPAEIERLVSTNSLGSPDMDVDFKMVSPILLGQHKQRKQKKSKDAHGNFPGDAEDSDGETQRQAEKAKAVAGKQTFSEKEAEKLRKQGFKVAGAKGSPIGVLGEGGNRDEGPDPSQEFTGISCYAPGWEKKIEPKVDDAGRGVQVATDSKSKKMKRLPMPSAKPAAPEDAKDVSAQPAVGKPATITPAHVDPVATPAHPADDEDDEDDEVVLPDFALRHAVDKRSSQPAGVTRGRGRGGARGGRGGASTSTAAATTETTSRSKLNPAAPTFVPPTMPMPFGMQMAMAMPFLRPGFPMGVPFVPPPPPPYTGGVKVGDNTAANAKKGKGDKASPDSKGNGGVPAGNKGGKSVPLPRSKQAEKPSEAEVKPAEAPTMSVRVGGKPAPTATVESTSNSAEGMKPAAGKGAAAENREKRGKDAGEKGVKRQKSKDEGEGKKEAPAVTAADAAAMKTKPCRFFSSPEGCRFGADCKFNHEAKAVAE